MLALHYKMVEGKLKKIFNIFAALSFFVFSPVAAGDTAKGKKKFKKCKSCHMIVDDSGAMIVKGGRNGPNLYAILGRTAGSIDGFKYGKSLATLGKSGFVWSEPEFVAYVADPKKYLVDKLDDKKARSKMSYKLKNEDDARKIWAYLESLSK